MTKPAGARTRRPNHDLASWPVREEKNVSKNVLWPLLGGAAVALLVSLAGCSSSCGNRGCRKDGAGPPSVLPAPPAGGGPVNLPAAPTGAAAPYGGQKFCPVNGEELGSMGKPIPVTVKGQTVFVCCRGCIAKAQADPDKTLATVAADRAAR